MGNAQIPNLPAIAAITPDSLFECVVGGVSCKVTAQQIIDSIVGPYLPISGGVMTGQIQTIAAVNPGDAINKGYIDGFYARLDASNTFIGDITISETTPFIILNDTDATVGGSMNSRLNFYANGIYNGFVGYNATQLNMETPQGSIGLRANQTGLGATSNIYFGIDGVTAGRIDAIGTSSPSILTTITREKGDARYLQLIGGTVTGDINISSQIPQLIINDTNSIPGGTSNSRVIFQGTGTDSGFLGFSGSQISILNYDGPIGISADANNTQAGTVIFLSVDGAVAGRVDPLGTSAPNNLTVITREKGDARYAPIVSDARLKTEVRDMPITALSAVMELRPVTYEWIQNEEDPKPTGLRYGLIAQEVQEVLPASILGSEENYLGLDPLSLIGVLVKAVQELNAKISVLEKASKTKVK